MGKGGLGSPGNGKGTLGVLRRCWGSPEGWEGDPGGAREVEEGELGWEGGAEGLQEGGNRVLDVSRRVGIRFWEYPGRAGGPQRVERGAWGS